MEITDLKRAATLLTRYHAIQNFAASLERSSTFKVCYFHSKYPNLCSAYLPEESHSFLGTMCFSHFFHSFNSKCNVKNVVCGCHTRYTYVFEGVDETTFIIISHDYYLNFECVLFCELKLSTWTCGCEGL